MYSYIYKYPFKFPSKTFFHVQANKWSFLKGSSYNYKKKKLFVVINITCKRILSSVSFENCDPPLPGRVYISTRKHNMLALRVGVPFWLAEQTKPAKLKQLTSNAICWGKECWAGTWEAPRRLSPLQQASTPGWAASPQAGVSHAVRTSQQL